VRFLKFLDLSLSHDAATAADGEARQSAADAIAQWRSRRKAAEAAEIKGSVTMEGTGAFRCEYSTTRAGDYEIDLLYNGLPLPGSPHKLRVSPGPTHPRACVRLHCLDEAAPLPPCAAARKASFVLLAVSRLPSRALCSAFSLFLLLP
jgi:hypothetical protein